MTSTICKLVRPNDYLIVALLRSHSPCHQLIRPCFVGTDEFDLSGQAEGFEFAFDGLETAPEVIREAGGAKLPAVAQQFQDPLTPTRWRVLDLSRIGVGFPGVPNREPNRNHLRVSSASDRLWGGEG